MFQSFTINEAGTSRNVCIQDSSGYPRWVGYQSIFKPFILSYLLPSVILYILNFIIIAVLKCRKNPVTTETKDKMRSRKERRCLVTLLSVSTAYVILIMPYVIMWAMYFYSGLTNPGGRIANSLHDVAFCTMSLCNINYATNFIIYSVTLDFYRKDVKKLLSCGRNTH